MNKEDLRNRIIELQKQQQQINIVLNDAKKQAEAIIGHINEATHWLKTIINAEKTESETKE